jgi:hypothetical protein
LEYGGRKSAKKNKISLPIADSRLPKRGAKHIQLPMVFPYKKSNFAFLRKALFTAGIH